MPLVFTKNHLIHPDFLELSDYLGSSFNYNWCNASDEKGHEDAKSGKYVDNSAFVRNTPVFAYQSIGLAVQGIHRPYIARILELSADKGPVSLIEVGAGGGQLGLAFHTMGFDVSFADLYSLSQNFLLWRLRQRHLNLPVYVLDMEDMKIPKHDVAVCFDVIEHCNPDEQVSLIHRCAELGSAVFMNLIRGDGTELDSLHFAVDIPALTEYVNSHWTATWTDYYPDDKGARQRLLIYGDGVNKK